MSDELLPGENIRSRIYFIRGQRVMLGQDLAELYGVETKTLNRQVKRNIERFPAEDFMFQLTKEETESSRCQIGTLKQGQNIKYLPYAFTEQGVAMLSGVLNSKKAIEINIQIMREFIAMRHYLISKDEMEEVLAEKFDKRFKDVMDAFYQILETKTAGISIGNITNSVITMGDVTIGGSAKWADEAYKLIQKILKDLDEVKLPARAEKVIQENSKSLLGLLKEGKPARRRLKENLATIKTTLEIAAAGNAAVKAILALIGQVMRLLG